jgi:hypothetical protein
MSLCSRFVLVAFANANGYRTGFGADVKADTTSRTAGSGVSNRIIALAVQLLSLNQDFRRTRANAEGAPLAQVRSNNYVASIGFTHNILQAAYGNITLP